MKRNKILGTVITVVAVLALGGFFWQSHQQKAPENSSSKPISDNRVQVTNQDNPEYKSTVLVNSTEKESEYGTGYVVGKNTVATNRHVIQDVKSNPEKAVVRVGHKDEEGRVSFTDFNIKEIVTPKDDTMDVALLKLKATDDGKTVSDYREIAQFGDISKIKKGTELTLVGFPGDKEYGTMWAGTGKVDTVDGTMISFRVISAPGNSGSPLFDSDGKVVAMNNAGGEDSSFGFLIDKGILSFFKSNIE